MNEGYISYRCEEEILKGYLVKPGLQKAQVPGVIILHARMGVTEHEIKWARRLVALGYLAFACDLFGENHLPQTVADAVQESNYLKTNRKVCRARINAAIRQIIAHGADPERIGIIGFCLGGLGAIEAARGNLNVRSVVSFHGGLDKGNEDNPARIIPKILVLHGADDPFVPKSQVDAFQVEMTNANADWQIICYSDTVHSFTIKSVGNDKSKGSAYNEISSRRSWEHMKIHLAETLTE